MSVSEIMKNMLEKCEILLEGNVFSHEELIKSYTEFLSSNYEEKEHSMGIILHTGSTCFDAMLLIYAVISNLLENEFDVNVFISSLSKGDLVLYQPPRAKAGRFEFEGFNPPSGYDGEYIQLKAENECCYIPRKRWNLISPYYGNAERLDGRGLRKKTNVRSTFFREVLGRSEEKIPNIIETSTIIVMAREKANYLIENLRIRFGKNELGLLDLITASYFTEGDEYPYGGNAGKTEPVIKFTSKISVARQLLRSRNGNYHLGIMVCGEAIIYRNETELPELITRKSLKYTYISIEMDSQYAVGVIKDYSSAEVFACTKQFLSLTAKKVCVKNPITCELINQVNHIIDRELEIHTIDRSGFITWKEYCIFKQAMYNIRFSEMDSIEKDDFIVQAYSLMKLFVTAVFPISKIEKMISENKIEIESPEKRIDRLKTYIDNFQYNIKDSASKVIDCLESMYLYLLDSSQKENELKKILERYRSKKILLVVPKAYYAQIIWELELQKIMDSPKNLIITTTNRFKNSLSSDVVISVGNITGKHFNILRCTAAPQIVVLLHEMEEKAFKYKQKEVAEYERLLDRTSFTKKGTDDNSGANENIVDKDDEKIFLIEKNIEEYVNHTEEQFYLRAVEVASSSVASKSMSKVVAMVTFESGEYALLTKNYKAYSFNEVTHEVEEISIESINEGDSLVFTQNNNVTRDIVDSILSNRIKENQISSEICDCYVKSKAWKQELMNYMQEQGVLPKDIATKMIANGVSVNEATIKRWLDEDSRMVGPQKLESIQQIALLTENEDMFENAKEYFDACRTIRSVRVMILKQIGQAIMDRISGKGSYINSDISDIYDALDSIALVLQVKSIVPIKKMVSINLSNRPLNT